MRYIFTAVVAMLVLNGISDAHASTGACCLPDNSCVDLSEDGGEELCENLLAGTWMGAGSNCTETKCQATGACCLLTSEYECWDIVSEKECYWNGGEFLGANSTCANEGAWCQSVMGACCLDGSKCWDSVPEEECYWMGGEFIGDSTSCSQDAPWCVTYYGACCFGDSCKDWVEHDECEMMGGVFWLELCENLQDVEMCAPSGACCLTDGTCLTNVASDYCSELGGKYFGDGTWDCYECTPPTACCLDGVCEVNIDFVECLTAGGKWLGEKTCEPNPCPEPPCPGDLNESGHVDVDDLLALLAAFGANSTGDCDQDGDTDVEDLLILIAAWGECQ